ncbi:MAG: sigma-70 family RNA polymerase sigma factor [Clostridia bacterium]|nr:sigma-70 family RNA polymerase sigma factor [Clostridia bacterium]
MNDEQILALFFSRSEDAVVQLDLAYGKGCRKISARILSDSRDTEECVNDAYLGFWNAVPPARPNPIAAFLYKIVRNLSLRRFRDLHTEKRGSACELVLDEFLADVSGSGDPVADEAELRELSRLLNVFIGRLTKENRVIFLRRYWFMDAYRDIAESVGLSEKTVSVRLVRIRKQMRDFLTKEGMLL